MLVKIDSVAAIESSRVTKVIKRFNTVGTDLVPYTEITSKGEFGEEKIFTNTPFEAVIELLTQERK